MTKPQPGSRRSQRATRRRLQQRNRWIGLAAAVILVLVVIYVTVQETGGGQGLPAAEVPDPALGPADAPVELVEFADFGCPACRSWHSAGIRSQILATYGDQVRFVWKDFPVITSLSPQAAEAGHCAAAQGKFWPYHDAIYEGFSGLEMSALQRYAAQADLDLDAFTTCLDEGLMRKKVLANEQEARRLGLRGTPSFVLNARALAAAPSYEQLSLFIEQALAAQ